MKFIRLRGLKQDQSCAFQTRFQKETQRDKTPVPPTYVATLGQSSCPTIHKASQPKIVAKDPSTWWVLAHLESPSPAKRIWHTDVRGVERIFDPRLVILKEYHDEIGPLDRIPGLCLAWYLSLMMKNMWTCLTLTCHYLSRTSSFNQSHVDKGSTLNILPKCTLLTVGLTPGHLKQGSIVIQRFHQSEQHPLGKILFKSRFKEIEDFEEFSVT